MHEYNLRSRRQTKRLHDNKSEYTRVATISKEGDCSADRCGCPLRRRVHGSRCRCDSERAGQVEESKISAAVAKDAIDTKKEQAM